MSKQPIRSALTALLSVLCLVILVACGGSLSVPLAEMQDAPLTMTPEQPLWPVPTPFSDLRGEHLMAGTIRWMLIDAVLRGNIIVPGLEAEGEFLLAEVEIENQGREPAAFGRTAIIITDEQGAEHFIQETMTAKLAEEEKQINCLAQPVAPGKTQRCRVLFDINPPERANRKLQMILTDLRPNTDLKTVISLEFLGIEPLEDILEDEH